MCIDQIKFLFNLSTKLLSNCYCSSLSQITPKEALILEWKFAMKCDGSVIKPLRRRHNASAKYESDDSGTSSNGRR